MRIRTAFEHGDEIPGTYTCDGNDEPLPVTIEDRPDEARAYVLYFEDPDAPSGTFLHWKVLVPESGAVSEGTEETNDFGGLGYGGPCPPAGEQHRYVLTVYALSEPPGGETARTSREFEETFNRSIIAKASTEGTYSRASEQSRAPRAR